MSTRALIQDRFFALALAGLLLWPVGCQQPDVSDDAEQSGEAEAAAPESAGDGSGEALTETDEEAEPEPEEQPMAQLPTPELIQRCAEVGEMSEALFTIRYAGVPLTTLLQRYLEEDVETDPAQLQLAIALTRLVYLQEERISESGRQQQAQSFRQEMENMCLNGLLDAQLGAAEAPADE